MLFYVKKGVSNEFALTLTELATEGEGTDWLFIAKKDEGGEKHKFFLADTSPSIDRYNLFTLIEGTDATFTGSGEWEYEAYQMPDQDDTDETRGNLVEVGKFIVERTKDEVPTHDADTTAPVYVKD